MTSQDNAAEWDWSLSEIVALPQLSSNDESEAQDEGEQTSIVARGRGRSSGANTKRKRQSVSKNFIKRKRKKHKKNAPHRRYGTNISFPTTRTKRREELNEQIEKKSVREGAKILNDRLDRLKVKDMIEDMESHIYIQTVVMANNADNLFKPIVDSYDQIKRQWPARSDLEKIRGKDIANQE
ncbi:uncharacterized protein LOC111297803 [Durio zibethinus]|uniref:Uncharacterized protein LOC111297803 n=1 Tax=Durio zibethinus TaxID=66656 RepID=A0A6P5Z5W6_DURZI|nr:uncharacterized protein LOC111297803 [Durio zibethinus]